MGLNPHRRRTSRSGRLRGDCALVARWFRGAFAAHAGARIAARNAGVVQWQNGSFPSFRQGFDSPHPLHISECTKDRGAKLRPYFGEGTGGEKAPSRRATLGAETTGAAVNPTKLVGLILIVGGALALAFGGFSYTKDSSAVKIGPVELSVKEKETINVPLWAGVGAIVGGGLLLAFGKK